MEKDTTAQVVRILASFGNNKKSFCIPLYHPRP